MDDRFCSLAVLDAARQMRGGGLGLNAIAQDGETTWFEGVLLLAIYMLLGLAFLFV